MDLRGSPNRLSITLYALACKPTSFPQFQDCVSMFSGVCFDSSGPEFPQLPAALSTRFTQRRAISTEFPQISQSFRKGSAKVSAKLPQSFGRRCGNFAETLKLCGNLAFWPYDYRVFRASTFHIRAAAVFPQQLPRASVKFPHHLLKCTLWISKPRIMWKLMPRETTNNAEKPCFDSWKLMLIGAAAPGAPAV